MRNKQYIKEALELIKIIQGSIAGDVKDSVQEEVDMVILLLEEQVRLTNSKMTPHEVLLIFERIIVMVGIAAPLLEKFM